MKEVLVMTRSKSLARTQATSTKQAPRLYALQSPEIATTLAELRARYGKYTVPDAELRKSIDKAMGNKTLTEELYAMREGK